MSIVEDIQTQLDDGKYSAGVFVEFKKASDTVDHNIPLKKLDYYGVRGIANEWFASYLKNRKQCFNRWSYLNYAGNSKRCFTGPLLLLLYVNVINKSIKNLQMIQIPCFLKNHLNY